MFPNFIQNSLKIVDQGLPHGCMQRCLPYCILPYSCSESQCLHIRNRIQVSRGRLREGYCEFLTSDCSLQLSAVEQPFCCERTDASKHDFHRLYLLQVTTSNGQRSGHLLYVLGELVLLYLLASALPQAHYTDSPTYVGLHTVNAPAESYLGDWQRSSGRLQARFKHRQGSGSTLASPPSRPLYPNTGAHLRRLQASKVLTDLLASQYRRATPHATFPRRGPLA